MNGSCKAGLNRTKPAAGLATVLLCGTVLGGIPTAAFAQSAPAQDEQATPEAETAAPEPVDNIIRTITIVGSQRLEAQTILSYIRLRVGQEYTSAGADEALKDLGATELFSNFSIRNDGGNVVIEVTENPIINRIILEGNRRIKNDKILPEIKLSARQIFTRSKVRADVARIIELYKRQGRFAATVEPQMVNLPQNRVDIVFEINEGPKSKVRQINIIGNEEFSDSELRSEMVTKQSRFFRFFSSNTSYDPDRLAFDQQQLRVFYLENGYADFRVVSAVAELTPDKEDFIITYVVEEGERYKFGDVTVESQLRDFDGERLQAGLPMQPGDWYDAKQIEDTVEQITELAGTFGYAFADVQPQFDRNREDLTMGINFVIREAPRVYVERVDINGNTLTQDKVVRREFRIAEGDAFNSLQIARTTSRINSLGFFQENFEVNQVEGSQPDRIVLEANVQEQPTGELQLSAGFSSLERFILSASVRQRNFRGRGQTVGLSVNWSRFSRSASISFNEPYLFDRNISAGIDIFRREFNSFNFRSSDRSRTFEQSTTGFQLRAGVPITEFISLIGSYSLSFENVTLDENTFFADFDGDGISTCEPIIAGRFLCDAIGDRTSSIVGLNLVYSTLNSRFRPSRGTNISLSTEFAGLGGSVQYIRTRGAATKYWSLGSGFIFSLHGEGGYIHALEDRGGDGVDDVRLTDRFQLGEPQFRGFDIRGVGPRVIRQPFVPDGEGGVVALTGEDQVIDDAIGGNAYYLGRAELEIPLGSGARELGLRPSLFVDFGALFSVTQPVLLDNPNGIQQRDVNGNLVFLEQITGADGLPSVISTPNPIAADGVTPNVPSILPNSNFREIFLGNSASPRVSVGIGVNWNSPFGPFRIDFARILRSVEGDDTKTFSFNVGTQF